MTHLTLNNAGKARIRAKAKELGIIPPDFRLVAQLTGYPVTLVKQTLSGKAWRPKTKETKEVLGPPIPDSNMPAFAYEIHRATGLQLNCYRNIGDGTSEWVVVSPTNMGILLVWGREDICQGVQALSGHKLQGISTTQFNARLAAKPPRAEPVLDVLMEGEEDE
jgi:hypothetical protein